jgi:glucokinase
MYIGVDVGGSKTLVGVLDERGVIQESHRFPTPEIYEEFLSELEETVASFATKDFKACGVGLPATLLDRHNGIGRRFGNLPWQDVHIQADLEALLNCPVAVENDAKLACLSEAMMHKDVSGLLYVTISTGIGYAFCRDQIIDPNIGDGGGRLMLQAYNGSLQPWESFASGKAIVERYGKKASEITDEATWQRIAHDLSGGFMQLIAMTEPDLVVVGGSVGHYFERLKPYLDAELQRYATPLQTIPPLEEAARPEEAVLYGCYDYARQRFGDTLKQKAAAS